MVYLIESSGYYKIGSTENLLTRLKAYKTNNPIDIIVLDIIELAGEIEENQLHRLLKEYNYRNEWYIKDKEVIKIWNEFKSKNKPLLNSKLIKKVLNDISELRKENKCLKNKILIMKEQFESLENKIKQCISGKYNI